MEVKSLHCSFLALNEMFASILNYFRMTYVFQPPKENTTFGGISSTKTKGEMFCIKENPLQFLKIKSHR